MNYHELEVCLVQVTTHSFRELRIVGGGLDRLPTSFTEELSEYILGEVASVLRGSWLIATAGPQAELPIGVSDCRTP